MFTQPASAVEGQQAPLPLMPINPMAAVAPTMMADAAVQPHLVLPVPLLMSTSAQYGMAVGAAAATAAAATAAAATAAAATAAAATAAAYSTNQALSSASDPTASALKTFTATEAASLGSVMASGAPEAEKRIHLRKGAGRIWSDPTLDEWPENDFRVFCGDLGNEVTDEVLANAFRKYKSFEKARVVRDKRTGKTKGYGFASFSDPNDMLRALKEMNFKYVGNRPIRVLRSKWKDREVDSERNKKFQEVVVEQPANSKTLRKFKKLGVTVNGGKMARQQQAAAAMGVKVKKNYVPVATYGRMTYQYIKGTHTMAPVPSQVLVMEHSGRAEAFKLQVYFFFFLVLDYTRNPHV